MRKQHKNYPSRIRPSGQTTLQSFLLFKPRAPDAEEKPSPQPAAAAEPPKRGIIKTTKTAIKEKASAFASVGSAGKGGEAGGVNAVNESVFKRFGSLAAAAEGEEGGDGFSCSSGVAECSKKRKSPFGDHTNIAKHVLVLSDDPKPRPKIRRQAKARDSEGNKTPYNHYASGRGWWHGDMEGVDGDEVGWTDEMWEGMGSMTLGGLDWH